MYQRTSHLFTKLIGIIAMVFATLFCFYLPTVVANAEESKIEPQMSPGERGTVIYNQNEIFTMTGTKHGEYWSDKTSTMLLRTENGQTELVFCIEPGIPLPNVENPDYEAIEVNDVDHRAQIAAAIWTRVFPNQSIQEQIVTQAVIWENLSAYGLNINNIEEIPNFDTLKAQLNQAIDEYDQKPDFHNQSIELLFGETTTLQSGGVNLNLFDQVIENSANVDFQISENGQSVAVTPTDPTKTAGSYQAKNSYMEGTPLAFEKEGSQTVMVARIKNTNQYNVNFNIRTNGRAMIQKIDKESGVPVPGTRFEVTIDGKVQTVETDEQGQAMIENIPHGTVIQAKEVFVPAPYVLASTLGESDVVEGTVQAGETITLTQKNSQALGQIIIDKSGELTGKELWNEHYSLAGNIFEIRQESEKGEIIQTITTDKNGHASTGKDLPLGKYVVMEKQASLGFAKTFTPVTVEIKYANQTTSIVIENAKGTNKEVTGSATLVKEDAESGNESQGRASLHGAQYALLYEDGTPVKWTDAFAPVLVSGTKVDEESIIIQVDDENLKIIVEHLALGKYKWQETTAPEGYQRDKEIPFEITYKDQHTEVVATNHVSKEQVIKFNLDGFKYVDSKSGGSKTGYNDIEFSLTPLENTKGEVQKSVTVTDKNGYDGYWNFTNVVYGDYVLKEENTPNGYKAIKDLFIHSTFDQEMDAYQFTITEDGQKEPLKVTTIPAEKIHQGDPIISLSKLFLTNNLVRLPEIRTLATVDGEKTFMPNPETLMKDKISIFGLYEKELYTNKIKLWRIQDSDYENATIVFETEHDFVAETENIEQVIDTLADTTNDDEKTKYVWTEELYDEEGNKVAEHTDLKNEDQTVRPIMPGTPTIETLFITKDNQKEFDPTKNQTLIDKVKATVPKKDVGKTFYYVTEFHKVDEEGNATVLYTDESERKAESEVFEFEVVFDYQANMIKNGEKIVATHIAYLDKEYTNEYAKHFDLTNEKQTLTGKTPTSPDTPKKLPQTSGTLGNNAVLITFFSVFVASIITIAYTKNKKHTKK